MKVFLTGATGVLGREIVPRLVVAGHDVTAVARSEDDASWLTSAGAKPIAVDLFDPEAITLAVEGQRAVYHFATAIPPFTKMKKSKAWAINDRLRREAASNLVDAAVAAGAEAFIQESITFAYADGSDHWLSEDARIDPVAPFVVSALEAERHVRRFTEAGGRGISLRLSRLYGPGNASGETITAVTKRMSPIIGAGGNYVSSLHVIDAGAAAVAALDAPAGAYNVSDDNPVTAAEYATSLAQALGAPPPRRIPRWLARIVTGEVYPMMTISHRVSNAAFKAVAGWQPEYRSVLEGWPEVVRIEASAA